MPSNVTIRITADTTQLNSQLAIAKAEFAATQKALSDLAREAAKNGLSAGLKADMNKASEAMLAAKNQVTSLTAQLGGLKPPSNFHSQLEQALSIGTFLLFEQVASQTMHAVESAFDATIEKAEQFTLSNAKFAAQLGVDTTTATGLSEALKGVGSSSEEYAGMALKLERQLKTNEKGLNSLGMATRDQNHDLLDGKALMESAISTMEKYKAGTDQNEFALLALGRGAKDVYDIMRVTDAQQQQYIEDMKALGVATGTDAVEAGIKLEEEQARLRQQFEDVKIALGQHLMPTITAFIRQLNDSGATQAFEDGLMGIAETTMEVSAIIATGFKIVEVTARETSDVVVGLAETTFRASIGDYAGAAAAASGAWKHMKSDAANAGADIGNIFDALDADIQRFQLGVAGSSAKSPFPSGGQSYTPPPDTKAAEAAAKRLLEQQARDYAEFQSQMNSMQRDDLATTQSIEKTKLQTTVQVAEQEFQEAKITADEKFAILAAAAQKEHDLTVQALRDDMARSETTMVQANHDANQILVIDEQLTERRSALARQLTADQRTEIQKRIDAEKSMAKELLSSEDQLVSNIFAGNQTLTQDLIQLGSSLLEKEIANDLKAMTTRLLFTQEEIAADKSLQTTGYLFHLFAEGEKTGAAAAGEASRTAIASTAAAGQNVVAATSASKSILNDAYTSAAAAYRSVMQAVPPPFNLILAPVAAAGTFAAVAAFDVISAEGGEYNVNGGLYNLHAREAVMPARVAEPMREYFERGNAGGARYGDNHYHTWNIGGADDMMSSPAKRREFMSFITNAIRNSRR